LRRIGMRVVGRLFVAGEFVSHRYPLCS
jgi:hypothetical protein